MDTTELLVQSSLTPVAFSLVLAAVMSAAWWAYRQGYLAHWAGYWFLYVLAWPLNALSFALAGRPLSAAAASAGASFLSFGARALFVLGTFEYMEWRKPRRAWLWAAGAVMLVLVLGEAAAREGIAAGRLPGWAAVPFRNFTLGGAVKLALGVQVVRASGEQRVPRAVLATALIGSGLSDAWDFSSELFRGLHFTSSLPGLRASLFVSQLADALTAAGMLVAAIGTERRRAERALAAVRERDLQLDRVHRLEVVGQLAGGLAHDFNNLLTVIVASLDFIGMRLHSDDKSQRDVAAAAQAADRAAKLTRQLLTFARQQRVEPRVIDLAERVRAVDRMLAVLAGERVERRVQAAEGLWPAFIDPSQLEQLLVNLVVNSRDAMPGGGTLLIETQNVTLGGGPRPPEARNVPAGEWVVLSVQDSGQGMSAEVMRRIFEPFFTTKPPGQGTGLGLATSFGIAQQAGGHIGVSSAPGKGARFSLFLPRYRGPLADRPKSAGPAAGGAEKVLVVENEEGVREVTVRLLEGRGYTVLQACSGPEALAAPLDGVRLVVSDIVMPEMDGWELVRKLRARAPGLPALFMSGFVPEGTAMPQASEGRSAFLSKPFAPDQLAARVRELLDG